MELIIEMMMELVGKRVAWIIAAVAVVVGVFVVWKWA